MGNRTDQDEPRKVGDRLAPPTTPDKDTIAEDRADVQHDHGADRMPTPEEEEAAERHGPTDPQAADAYKEAIERGAATEGEGRVP